MLPEFVRVNVDIGSSLSFALPVLQLDVLEHWYFFCRSHTLSLQHDSTEAQPHPSKMLHRTRSSVMHVLSCDEFPPNTLDGRIVTYKVGSIFVS
jgi:hypothetical protein